MGEIRTCIRKGAYGQRLKRYPFCCLRKHLRFLERKRKNTAGVEQQRQKDTSEKRGGGTPVRHKHKERRIQKK